MELVIRFQNRMKPPKVLLGLSAFSFTILTFIVLVETSYLRWHSSILVLIKFLAIALICNSGLIFSNFSIGRKYRIFTAVLMAFGLVAVPLVVGSIHKSLCGVSLVITLWAMGELFWRGE